MEVNGKLHSPTHFTSRNDPRYSLDRKMGKFRDDLEAVEKGIIFSFYHESNPDSSAVQPIASRYND
jgi:hypothetical protein